MSNTPFQSEGEIWIASRLKAFGFFPEFSNNSDYYFRGLALHLGARKKEKFLTRIDNILYTGNPLSELQIASLAGNDRKLLKMVYSTGIYTSVVMLDRMMDMIDEMNINPNHIVDFGGANGWSLKLLKEYLDTDVKLSLIEQNSNWGCVDEEIDCYFDTYGKSNLNNKADLGISIFGAPSIIFEELTECINRNLNESAILIAGLRIANNNDFITFLDLMNKNHFFLNPNLSERITINTESFPIMVFERKPERQQNIISLSDLKISK